MTSEPCSVGARVDVRRPSCKASAGEPPRVPLADFITRQLPRHDASRAKWIAGATGIRLPEQWKELGLNSQVSPPVDNCSEICRNGPHVRFRDPKSAPQRIPETRDQANQEGKAKTAHSARARLSDRQGNFGEARDHRQLGDPVLPRGTLRQKQGCWCNFVGKTVGGDALGDRGIREDPARARKPEFWEGRLTVDRRVESSSPSIHPSFFLTYFPYPPVNSELAARVSSTGSPLPAPWQRFTPVH